MTSNASLELNDKSYSHFYYSNVSISVGSSALRMTVSSLVLRYRSKSQHHFTLEHVLQIVADRRIVVSAIKFASILQSAIKKGTFVGTVFPLQTPRAECRK